MSLTIDDGNMVYFVKSSNEIKSLKITSGSEQITYRSASCKDLSRSSTAVTVYPADNPPTYDAYRNYIPSLTGEVSPAHYVYPTCTEIRDIGPASPASVRKAASVLCKLVARKTYTATERGVRRFGRAVRKLKSKVKKNTLSPEVELQ